MFIQDTNLNFIETDNKKIPELINGKFVVALDFDGVVTNPYKLKTKYINELGYNIKPEQSGRHTCINVLGIPFEDYETGSIRSYTESPAKLPLETDFRENFSRIRNLEKIVLFFVTSRYDNMLQHLQEYMKYHKIKVDGVIHTQNKTKINSLKLINAKIFVDDSPKKIEEILLEDSDFFEKCNLILYRNIANKIETNPDRHHIIEVKNWGGIVNIITIKYQEF